MSYVPSELDSGPIELTLTLDADGPVSGESPTVRVRESGTLNSYLDFDDDTFKTSGWTTRDQPMVETSEPGTYVGILDPSAITNMTAGVWHVVAEFRNAGSVIPGADQAIVSLFDSAYKIPTDTTDAVWDEPTAAHQLPGSMGEAQGQAGSGASFRGAIWTVLAGASTTSVPTDSTRPDGFYDGMQVSIVRATGEVVARNVESYVAGAFNFLSPLPFVPAAGETVEVWRQAATAGEAALNLDPIYRAIEELLKKLSQVGVNIRAQIVSPTLYAGHKGDELQVVVYQDGAPIADADLAAASDKILRIESIDTGERFEVPAVDVAGGILAYTLTSGDGIMDDPAKYRVQGRAELADTGDVRWSEVRIYNVAAPLSSP